MSDAYDWTQTDREMLEKLAWEREQEAETGFSAGMADFEHSHFCNGCRGDWDHEDAECIADDAYPCPDHQPRTGAFFVGSAGEREGH